MKYVKNKTINFLFLRKIVIPTNKLTRSSQSFYCLVTKLNAYDEITRFDGIS